MKDQLLSAGGAVRSDLKTALIVGNDGIDMASGNGHKVASKMKRAIARHFKKTLRLVKACTLDGAANVECVHQLRTSTRRADAALELISDWLPQSTKDRVHKKLKQIRRSAGAVRDLDILVESLDLLRDQLPKSAARWLRKRTADMRQDAVGQLQRLARKQLKGGLKRRLSSVLTDLTMDDSLSVVDLQSIAAARIRYISDRLFTEIELFENGEQHLHQARIWGRRLRYLNDLLDELLDDPLIQSVNSELTAMQSLLGYANDRMSVISFLRARALECGNRRFGWPLRRSIELLDKSTTRLVSAAMLQTAGKSAQLRVLINQLCARYATSIEGQATDGLADVG